MNTDAPMCGCELKEKWEFQKKYPLIVPNAMVIMYGGCEYAGSENLVDIKKIDFVDCCKKVSILIERDNIFIEYTLKVNASFMIHNYP